MARRGRIVPATVPAALLTMGLAVVLALAVLELPDEPGGLTPLVAENLAQSGVAHPVTAVLLNFRAYDTWLELGVLVLAVIGLLVVQRAMDLSAEPVLPPVDQVLVWLVKLLVPIAVLIGGFLLWLGTDAPGGAFQAGAVLGAAGVLLRLAGYRSVAALRGWTLRMAALLGFGVFMVVAVGVLATGRALLEYPLDWAGGLILLIELAATIAIALALVALFTGARPISPDADQVNPPSTRA
jgi:multisubunit Na+/H+ antiporter MnhB subunit